MVRTGKMPERGAVLTEEDEAPPEIGENGRLRSLAPIEPDYYVRFGADLPADCRASDDDSSDDEFTRQLQQIAGYPPRQKNRANSESKGDDQSDAFESDMDTELNNSLSAFTSAIVRRVVQDSEDATMPDLEDVTGSSVPTSGGSTRKQVTFGETTAMEKDDEEPNPIKQKVDAARNQAKPDFYDSDEDEDNQRWVDERRAASKRAKVKKPAADEDREAAQIGLSSSDEDDDEGGPSSSSPKKKKNASSSRRALLENTDAVLSCPACMALLTRDCQRHDIYKEQYRAMLVENCVPDTSERLQIAESSQKKLSKKKAAKGQQSFVAQQSAPATAAGFGGLGADEYFAVRCAHCQSQVGVVDREEIYHFFNVLAGY